MRLIAAAMLVLAWGCGDDDSTGSDTGTGLDGSTGRCEGVRPTGACYPLPLGDCCVGPGLPLTCLADGTWGCVEGYTTVARCPQCEGDAGAGDAGTSAAWAVCTRNSECTLVAAGCCAPCGLPSLESQHAVNTARLAEHMAEVCPMPEPCPECATGYNPDLQAACSGGRCRALDVRTLPLSECTRDSDCRLRAEACCECGADTSPFALIAINASRAADYTPIACDPDQGCAECEPVYPDLPVICAEDGHCQVTR